MPHLQLLAFLAAGTPAADCVHQPVGQAPTPDVVLAADLPPELPAIACKPLQKSAWADAAAWPAAGHRIACRMATSSRLQDDSSTARNDDSGQDHVNSHGRKHGQQIAPAGSTQKP